MSLAQFRYVIAVARELHFQRAAERCFVSQPTLSMAIKKLEQRLGITLFERGSKGVIITPNGRLVIAQIEKTLAESNRIYDIAKSMHDPLSLLIRLGTIFTIGPYLLPSLIPKIKHIAPKMTLAIEEDFTSRLLDALHERSIDIAVLALPIETSQLITKTLYDEQFCVLMPKRHPWAERDEIAPALLLEEPLLMVGRGNCFRSQVLDLCALVAERNHMIIEGSSLSTIHHMVASGVAVTVMPAAAVANIDASDPLLTVRPFTEPIPKRTIALVWHKNFAYRSIIETLENAVMRCSRQEGGPLPLQLLRKL